jgi:hypothetical protein
VVGGRDDWHAGGAINAAPNLPVNVSAVYNAKVQDRYCIAQHRPHDPGQRDEAAGGAIHLAGRSAGIE